MDGCDSGLGDIEDFAAAVAEPRDAASRPGLVLTQQRVRSRRSQLVPLSPLLSQHPPAGRCASAVCVLCMLIPVIDWVNPWPCATLLRS